MNQRSSRWQIEILGCVISMGQFFLQIQLLVCYSIRKIRWTLTLQGSEGKPIIPHLGKVNAAEFSL